jgi:ATP-binding cassette subfamily F protein 3
MKEDRRKEKEKQVAERQKKQGLSSLEKQIETLETEVSDIEAMMCEDSVYSDSKLMRELTEQLNHLKRTLEDCYDEWSVLLEEV